MRYTTCNERWRRDPCRDSTCWRDEQQASPDLLGHPRVWRHDSVLPRRGNRRRAPTVHDLRQTSPRVYRARMTSRPTGARKSATSPAVPCFQNGALSQSSDCGKEGSALSLLISRGEITPKSWTEAHQGLLHLGRRWYVVSATLDAAGIVSRVLWEGKSETGCQRAGRGLLSWRFRGGAPAGSATLAR